ncbi:MAG: hypothetical protein M3Z75_03060 [Actinomycetota bacterium]|nr:hypothetical protein [Actinomycetota bacterium]
MTGSQPAVARQRLRTRAIVVSLLLVAQFFLGMITNLYVTIPGHHPGANAHNYFSGAASSVGWAISGGGAWLAMHASLGVLLVIGAIEFIVAAARSRNGTWIWTSIAGAAFIMGAAFNGASFLVFNKDYSSLIMAGLFGLSLSSYVIGIYRDGRQPWAYAEVTTGAVTAGRAGDHG